MRTPDRVPPDLATPASPPSGRWGELARRWAERGLYGRRADWLWSLYDRALNSRPGRWLPLRGRVRAVRVASEGRPYLMRLGTTDWQVLEELALHRGYDAALAADLGTVRQIVDLGANIGMSVRLWQRHFPGARVAAVEPDGENLEMCRRNAEAGGGAASVAFIRACAAATPRRVGLDRSRGAWGFTMTDASAAGGDDAANESIPAMTVPQICAAASIEGEVDLLKCDIEGAERELFASCADWVGRVRNLIVELHDDYTPAAFAADLARNGARFTPTSLGEGHGYALLLLRREGVVAAPRQPGGAPG